MPIEYRLKGKKRSQKLAPDLESILVNTAKKYNYKIVVHSGGQDPKNRVGSDRHDHGHAGDISIHTPDGVQLDGKNKEHQPILQEFFRDLVANGVTSIGAGDQYMGGNRFHVDNAIVHGKGQKGVQYWGNNGKSKNAPNWLVDVFDGAPTPTSTPQTTSGQEPINLAGQSQTPLQPVSSDFAYVPTGVPLELPSTETPIDYSLWNQYGWMDGQVLKTDGQKSNSESPEVTEEIFNTLLKNVKNPTLKAVLKTAFSEGTKGKKSSVTPAPIISLANEDKKERKESEQPRLSASSPTPVTSQSNPTTKGVSGMYNAGNLKDPVTGEFRSFATPEEGFNALKTNSRYIKQVGQKTPVKPDWTLEQAMGVYAPESDNNNPKAYAKFIADQMGVSVSTPINQLDTDAWAKAISKMEGNESYLGSQKKNGGKLENGGWLDFVNDTGYTRGTKTEANPINIIPSNNITMNRVDYPVLGTDNKGVTKLMMPNNNYKFEGDFVVEKPIKNWLNNL